MKGPKKSVLPILFLLFFSFYLSFVPLSIKADDSSPSATMSASLRSKLQALQAEIASKAAQLKLEVGKKLQNRAYIGYIKSKSDTTITLALQDGSKLVNVDEYTKYDSNTKSKTKTSLKTLSIDDFVAALGDVDETEVLTAKKVVKLASVDDEEKQIVFGSVISINDTSLNLETHDKQNLALSTSSETSYQLGKQTGAFGDIKLNKPVIAVTTLNPKSKVLKARFIYIFPEPTSLKPKIATASATPTASSSGQKKKK